MEVSMNQNKLSIHRITSPAFPSSHHLLIKELGVGLKEYFIKRYSTKDSKYIDQKFNVFFKKLLMVSEGDKKVKLNEYRKTISSYLYRQIITQLAPYNYEIDHDKSMLRIRIDLILSDLFFFSDLVVYAIAKDYKGINKIKNSLEQLKEDEKYINVGKAMSGKSVLNQNLEHYEIAFRNNEEIKSVLGKDNFRSAAYTTANQIGYEHESEKQQFYDRFRKYKYNHSLIDLKSFLNHKKALTQNKLK